MVLLVQFPFPDGAFYSLRQPCSYTLCNDDVTRLIIPFDLEVQGLGVRTNFLLKKNSLPSVRLQDCMKIYLTLL